jgi:hypothetical protein
VNVEDGPVDESDEDESVESRRMASAAVDCFVHWADATHMVNRGTLSV